MKHINKTLNIGNVLTKTILIISILKIINFNYYFICATFVENLNTN